MKHLAIKTTAGFIVAGSLYFGLPALFKATVAFLTISSGLFMLIQVVAPSLFAIALCFSAYALVRNQENFPAWDVIKQNVTDIYTAQGSIGLIKASLKGVFNEWTHFTRDLSEYCKLAASFIANFFSNENHFDTASADINLLHKQIGAPIGSALHSATQKASEVYQGAQIMFSAAAESLKGLLPEQDDPSNSHSGNGSCPVLNRH
jgi:hypothetical protein